MSLINTIRADQFAARKDGSDKIKIALLTTLYSEAFNIGLSDFKRETTDKEVVEVVQKFLKNLNECIKAADKTGTDKTTMLAEKAILETYLPKQLSEQEIEAFVVDYVRDGGKAAAMKALKENYAGQYDGRLASSVVDNLIASWCV